MPPTFTLFMLATVILELTLVVAILPAVVALHWSPIADRYPPRAIAASATHRRFQSFNAAILSLTWCIHVAADDDHLHLRPSLLARLMGIREASIPWRVIELDAADTRPRTRRAWIADRPLDAPRWCFDRTR